MSAIVHRAVNSGLPEDSNGIYVVLSASDVAEGDWAGTFCNDICGQHFQGNSTNDGGHYHIVHVGNPLHCMDPPYTNDCWTQYGPTAFSPNGSPGVDDMVTSIFHEAIESLTDPQSTSFGPNGWFADSAGGRGENGDLCNNSYTGLYRAPGGGVANVHLNGHDFAIQDSWTNLDNGGCKQNLSGLKPSVGPAFFQINGTGSDMILRDSSTGQMALWLMNGTSHSTSLLAAPSPVWQVKGYGDFDHDGITDILWQNVQNKTTWVWHMNAGGSLKAFGWGSPWDGALTNDAIEAVADLHGDLSMQIITSHRSSPTTKEYQVSGMDGGTVIWTRPFPTIFSSMIWSVAAVGHLDGNGQVDLVWQTPSGNIGISYTDQVWAKQEIKLALPAAMVLAMKDMDGDGIDDILVEKDGSIGYYRMTSRADVMANGAAHISYFDILQPLSKGTAFDQQQVQLASKQRLRFLGATVINRVPGLLWQDAVTGTVTAWTVQQTLFNGTRVHAASLMSGLFNRWEILRNAANEMLE
jgi:hypothetical protein